MKLTTLLLVTLLIPTSLIGAEQCHFTHDLIEKFNHLKSQQSTQPAQLDTLIELSSLYQAIGIGDKALTLAESALSLDAKSGEAMVAKIHALHLLGKKHKALNLAVEAFEDQQGNYQFHRRMKSWLRHSILAMYLEAGKLKQAEQLILKHYPNVMALQHQQVTPLSLKLGIPLHTLEPLIYILRATNRTTAAEKLNKHLQGFSAESFFKVKHHQLAATQHWMLASIWAATPDKHLQVIENLTEAYNKGFIIGWRFNYAHHPVYWPLQQQGQFKQLIATIEQDMQRVKNCLNTNQPSNLKVDKI